MQESQRFYFEIPPITNVAQLFGVLVIAQWVAFVLLTQSILLGVLVAPIAVVGLYLIIRKPGADFFAEIGPRSLTIRMVFSYRIAYPNIESVRLFRNESRQFMDLVNRIADKWSRLFGGAGYDLVPIGETNRRRVQVRLQKPMLLVMPFPPFRVEKKGVGSSSDE
jgi:CBS domain containing-hemolysin-like protein